MESLVYILLFILIVWWLYLSPWFHRKNRLADKFPGPRAYPIFGNLFELLFRSSDGEFKVEHFYGIIYFRIISNKLRFQM